MEGAHGGDEAYTAGGVAQEGEPEGAEFGWGAEGVEGVGAEGLSTEGETEEVGGCCRGEGSWCPLREGWYERGHGLVVPLALRLRRLGKLAGS